MSALSDPAVPPDQPQHTSRVSARSDRSGEHTSLGAGVPAQDIVALLGAFLGFLDAGQPGSAAQLWDVPALILGDAHVHGAMSIDRLAAWLRDIDDRSEPGEPTSYELPGAGGTRSELVPPEPLIERLAWISARVAAVEARWPRRPRGGLLAGVQGTTFLIRVDEFGQAKIRGLLLHSPCSAAAPASAPGASQPPRPNGS